MFLTQTIERRGDLTRTCSPFVCNPRMYTKTARGFSVGCWALARPLRPCAGFFQYRFGLPAIPPRHKLTRLGIDRYLTRGENQPICFHGLGIRSNCIWSVFRLDDLLHSYDCLFFGCAKQRRDSIRNTQRRPKWTERIASFTQKSSVIEPALADGWK